MKPNRRTILRSLASAPVAAGFVWTEAEAQQAHHQAQAAKPRQKTADAVPAEVLHPPRIRDGHGCWST